MESNILSVIKDYFSILEANGTYDYNNVYGILLYIFMNEIAKGRLSKYLKEKDLEKIISATKCLTNQFCILPKFDINDFKDIKCLYDDTPRMKK